MQRDISKLLAADSGPTPTAECGREQQPWFREMMLMCCSERFLVVEAENAISYLIRCELQLEPCDNSHPFWEAVSLEYVYIGKWMGFFRVYSASDCFTTEILLPPTC